MTDSLLAYRSRPREQGANRVCQALGGRAGGTGALEVGTASSAKPSFVDRIVRTGSADMRTIRGVECAHCPCWHIVAQCVASCSVSSKGEALDTTAPCHPVSCRTVAFAGEGSAIIAKTSASAITVTATKPRTAFHVICPGRADIYLMTSRNRGPQQSRAWHIRAQTHRCDGQGSNMQTPSQGWRTTPVFLRADSSACLRYAPLRGR